MRVRRVCQQFSGRSESVASARRFVQATLARWEVPHLEETAALLSSELASNAVQYAGGDYQLAVELDPTELRVEVIDPSPTLPEMPPARAPADEESGRGLLLVEALAARSGVKLRRGGKAVWFALSVGGDPWRGSRPGGRPPRRRTAGRSTRSWFRRR